MTTERPPPPSPPPRTVPELERLVTGLLPWRLQSEAASLRAIDPRKSERHFSRVAAARAIEALPPGGPDDPLAWAVAVAGLIGTLHHDDLLLLPMGRWELPVPILGLEGGRIALTALGLRGVGAVRRGPLIQHFEDEVPAAFKETVARLLARSPVRIEGPEDAQGIVDRVLGWFGGEEIR